VNQAAPFAKGSWQHAVDDHLVGYGRTSEEFASPHEAMAWLLMQVGDAAVACHAPTLHNAIINLPCATPPGEAVWVAFYKDGHRDARHAAADLVAEGRPWAPEAGGEETPVAWMRHDNVYDITTHPEKGPADPMRFPVYARPTPAAAADLTYLRGCESQNMELLEAIGYPHEKDTLVSPTEYAAELKRKADAFDAASPAAAAGVPTLICPKCKVDRYKEPCGGQLAECPMVATALSSPTMLAAKEGA
jgi:hypothetical protein